MFTLKDPSSLNADWILSKPTSGENPIKIPKEVTQYMQNYHLMGVQFLYHSYIKGFEGAILNEDEDMNMALQICAFLTAISGKTSDNLIIIVCPNSSLVKWHFHLSNNTHFNVIKLQNANIDNLALNDNYAVILEFSDIKLFGKLEHLDFNFAIIDNFDSLANKNIIRKIGAKYKIGATTRNFYQNPDQKLKWKMLNWANQGSVGKLQEFYTIDSSNLANFRDNYRQYWLRLTWNFCESFKKPSEHDLLRYAEKLQDWANENGFDNSGSTQSKGKSNRKRKIIEKSDESSSDTIIYDSQLHEYVKLPSMDENPIVSSIIKNLEADNYGSLREKHGGSSKNRDNGIIMSFFDSFDNSSRASTSRSDSDNFVASFIKNDLDDENIMIKDDDSDDIDAFLKETNAMLQKYHS